MFWLEVRTEVFTTKKISDNPQKRAILIFVSCRFFDLKVNLMLPNQFSTDSVE